MLKYCIDVNHTLYVFWCTYMDKYQLFLCNPDSCSNIEQREAESIEEDYFFTWFSSINGQSV